MKNTVVFFGSGPVAAESLTLLMQHTAVEAVITKPTTLNEMTAVAGTTPVYAVSKRAELDQLMGTEKFTSELGVLIDFGIIVPRDVIDYFKLGIINSHFSILPQWRGADPISFSILSGQEKTGVSLMLIDEGMDTGKLLTTRGVSISPHDTTPSLTKKLILLSNQLLYEFIPRYINGTVRPRQQPHPERATYSRKLTKADGILDWSKSAQELEREIRAFIEWPKSRATIGGKDVIITAAHSTPTQPKDASPGKFDIIDGLNEFGIVAGKGTLWIDTLKPAGKKEMTAAAFLAGYRHLLN